MSGGGQDGGDWEDDRIGAIADAASGEGVKGLFRMVTGALQALRRHRAARLEPGQAMAELGIPTRETAFRHYSVHPEYDEAEPHPDNEAALAALTGALAREAHEEDRFREQPQVDFDPNERNIALVGSPSSDELSGYVFGYRPDPGKTGYTLRDWSLGTHLHFRWELDPAVILEGANVRRNVPGRGEVSRRNWAIVDQTGETEKLIKPKPDEEGFLDRDYLLLTRIPNFITPIARGAGHSIVSIGGAHGTATRAVELLLQSPAVVRATREAIGNADAYQALYRVEGIRHDDPEAGTAARAISLERALPVTLDEHFWATAESKVRPAMVEAGWFLRDLPR